MGINKPSLYGAFGSKEELFRKALQKYLAGPVAYVAEALRQPSARGGGTAVDGFGQVPDRTAPSQGVPGDAGWA